MDYTRNEAGILIPIGAALAVGGVFSGQLVRNGEVIDEWHDHNLITNEGLNHILDTVLHGTAQVSTWYLGLFEGNYTPVATVTAATIAAASTECTAYNETTRQEYVEAAASAQSITNSAARATFTFNATKSIYGAFLVSASAKSATTGVLLSASRFSAAKAVANDDQLLLTYTANISSV